MGYWGWRPLLCGVFISAWVVGCNIVPDTTDPSAAAPSSYPIVTLTVGRLPTIGLSPPPSPAAATVMVTVEPTPTATPAPTYYVVQSGETLEEIAARLAISAEMLRDANPGATLEAGARLLIPRPTPLPLNVQAPTCYETSTLNLLCLGRVDNPLAFPVESVTVEVSLLQADGTTALRRASIEQMLIPAGSFAPYQASFTAEAEDDNAVNARLVSTVEEADAPDVTVLVEDVTGAPREGRVLVSATLYNPEARHVELLRVFITLLDGEGRVIGYRVMVFEAGTILDGGARFPLQIEMTPQVSDVTPEYMLYVEARAVED